MRDGHTVRQRAAARDALAARTRTLTGTVLAASAVLSGLFAGIAAASAPGHKLLTGVAKGRGSTASARTSSTAIPPLPAPAGPGNLSAPPPAAAAPSATQAPPVAVSGGS